jgi:hypothetical protein
MDIRTIDFLWLANHPEELQRLYAGQWLAIVGDRIVVAGQDGQTVYREARRRYPTAEIMLEVVTNDSSDLLALI